MQMIRVSRSLWVLLGMTLAFLALVEVTASLALATVRVAFGTGPADTRYSADSYVGADWSRDYFIELADALQVEWRPYVNWRGKAFTGRLITVDSNGIRATWKHPSVRQTSTIFVFGGSTIWGTGARDDFTIPSRLARLLWEEHAISANVVNFGQSGYVSTQEVIQLELDLLRGARPDLVIFYDGINDAFSSLQNRIAGHPQNEDHRRAEFNLTAKERRLDLIGEVVGPRAIRATATYQIVEALVRRLRPSPPLADATPDLVAETVDVYRANVAHVHRLGDAYGFARLFYWQPAIFDKPVLTSYEERRRHDFAYVGPNGSRAGGRDPAGHRASERRVVQGFSRDLQGHAWPCVHRLRTPVRGGERGGRSPDVARYRPRA